MSPAFGSLRHYAHVTSRRRRRRHVAARWAGTRVDTLVGRALRGLFVRGGVPYVGADALDEALQMLAPSCDPAVVADPDRVFAPRRRSTVTEVSRKRVRGGLERHFTFPTPYVPVHPSYEREFRGYDRVRTAHLFGWQHAAPAPASLLLVHGWGVGPKRLHETEFGVDYFFRQLGLDVYYYVLPFHWIRKPAAARFSGELFPSADLLRTNEGFIQTVQELRTAVGFIRRRNQAPLGVMGSSLGGYTAALLASVDDRIDFAVPVMPMASLAHLFWDQGDDDPIRRGVERLGMTRERFEAAWAIHAPLSHTPKVPREARMIVSATGDVLVPPRHTEALWHHWERPHHVRFAGGHILQVYRGHYHQRVAQRLATLGILPEAALRRAHPRWLP